MLKCQKAPPRGSWHRVAMTERVLFPYKNKNRGTQVVKLCVPFLFFFAHGAVPITPCAAHRAVGANKTTAHLKKENGMEELAFMQQTPHKLGDCPAKLRSSATTDPVFRRRFCRSACFSGATRFMWLDSSNLVARTEYHSRLVLSTPISKFSKIFLP